MDHPYLVVHSATANPAAAAAAQQQQQQEEEDAATAAAASAAAAGVVGCGGCACDDDGLCGLCHDPVEDVVVAGCGHGFCRPCVVEYIDTVDRVSGGKGPGGKGK